MHICVYAQFFSPHQIVNQEILHLFLFLKNLHLLLCLVRRSARDCDLTRHLRVVVLDLCGAFEKRIFKSVDGNTTLQNLRKSWEKRRFHVCMAEYHGSSEHISV